MIIGHLDVTNGDEMNQRVTEFAQTNGNRLDVMINNAGILLAGPFEEIDPAAAHKEIDVNCKGVINGLYAAFPYLRSTPSSVVVNLASASAIYGQPELAVYSATKFFIRAITEALDLEWERYGIRVISMWPLFVQTAMTDNVRTGTTDTLGIHLTAGTSPTRSSRPSSLSRAQGAAPGALPGRHADQGRHLFTRRLTRLRWANRQFQKRLSRS